MGYELDPWYITGLCEASASFTYSRSGKNIGLYFAVKMPAADNELIEKLYNYFGAGKVYDVQNVRYYRMTRIEELDMIVEHFDHYPFHGEKKKRYDVWKQILLLKKNKPGGYLGEIEKLAVLLSSMNPKKLPRV